MAEQPSPLVLVVDDDHLVRTLHVRALTQAGFRVAVAEDGERAVGWLRTQTPDAVIVDMALPRTSGIAVIEFLRGRPETRDLPVVAVTGIPRDDEMWGARSWGWDAYMTKPADYDVLAETLRRLIRRRYEGLSEAQGT